MRSERAIIPPCVKKSTSLTPNTEPIRCASGGTRERKYIWYASRHFRSWPHLALRLQTRSEWQKISSSSTALASLEKEILWLMMAGVWQAISRNQEYLLLFDGTAPFSEISTGNCRLAQGGFSCHTTNGKSCPPATHQRCDAAGHRLEAQRVASALDHARDTATSETFAERIPKTS